MRDDDVRREFLNLAKGDEIVFVDVDDDVCWLQFAQDIEPDILRAADLRHVAHGAARMNAEAGTANYVPLEPQAEEELGDRWDQRDDARVRVCARMHIAGSIDAANRRVGYQCADIQNQASPARGFCLRPATIRSNSQRGITFSNAVTQPICHGIVR